MNERVLVLGYFGYVNNQLDGQTVKTRNIYKLLKGYFNLPQLRYFDTQCFQVSRFKVLEMFVQVWRSDKLVYLPAQNNLRFFFPFIFLISRLKGIPIAYVVVGGWLADFIKGKPILQRFLKRVDLILPQSSALTERLEVDYGFKNVQTLCNFRIHDFDNTKSDETIKPPQTELRLVFMARVSRMKGVDTIFDMANHFGKLYGDDAPLVIDFYGQVKAEESEYFHSMVESTPFVSYKGILQPEDIYRTISRYDALVLPTKYFTEGFPGSLLDAYIAGIPVVVTEWKYAKEFVDHGISGLISKWGDDLDFAENVKRLFENRKLLQELQEGAKIKSRQYSPESAAKIISPFFRTSVK